MAVFYIQEAAGRRLDDIYVYTRERWGDAQAERYIHALFDQFKAIASRLVPWRPIPADFDVDGYYCRCRHHYIYWRLLPDDAVGIVTVLHEHMHQMHRFKEDQP